MYIQRVMWYVNHKGGGGGEGEGEGDINRDSFPNKHLKQQASCLCNTALPVQGETGICMYVHLHVAL